jgi:ABC-type branched-subunit amino acid transport system ATPase component
VTAAPVLRTESLGKSFGGFVALSQLTLDIVEGEVRGIIGPN